MPKKKWYLTLDTETATLPFANDICKTAKEKQTIAIAKPLVYDIGWTICDRFGNIAERRNYLVQETFFVPNVFNTAYYKDKRPIYINLLEQGKITAKLWNDIVKILLKDLERVELTAAYNCCFDFKKAIPFTERYISHLYSEGYNKWEEQQKYDCLALLRNNATPNNPEYLEPYLELRNRKFPLVDLWGMACEKLVNNDKYRDFCMKNSLFTASGIYFKSSAESVFQYLVKQPEFIEDHTALSDAEIETQILAQLLKKGGVSPSIQSFPFRELGYTYDYVLKNKQFLGNLIDAMESYMIDNCIDSSSGYWKRIENIIDRLQYEKEQNEKMKVLVFDMDGTIVDFYNYPDWLKHLNNKSTEPYERARPLYDMDEMKQILEKLIAEGWKIAITTWASKEGDRKYNAQTRKAKENWLKEHNFPYEILHCVKYGTEKSKCTKDLGGYQILIDDNKEVRNSWQNGSTIDATENVLEALKKLLKK